MLKIKGFITNLGKYNEGELVGQWIEFPISDDDLQYVLKAIGCNYVDENGEEIETGYEEYFFTDWETDFVNNFGEYENIDKINELAKNLEGWGDNTYLAACEIWGCNNVDVENPDDYWLYTDIKTDYGLGYYYAVEFNCIDFRNEPILENYFDFEAYGRDIRLERDGGFSSYGWIEHVD